MLEQLFKRGLRLQRYRTPVAFRRQPHLSFRQDAFSLVKESQEDTAHVCHINRRLSLGFPGSVAVSWQ